LPGGTGNCKYLRIGVPTEILTCYIPVPEPVVIIGRTSISTPLFISMNFVGIHGVGRGAWNFLD
jgi:hypothetical protein